MKDFLCLSINKALIADSMQVKLKGRLFQRFFALNSFNLICDWKSESKKVLHTKQINNNANEIFSETISSKDELNDSKTNKFSNDGDSVENEDIFRSSSSISYDLGSEVTPLTVEVNMKISLPDKSVCSIDIMPNSNADQVYQVSIQPQLVVE